MYGIESMLSFSHGTGYYKAVADNTIPAGNRLHAHTAFREHAWDSMKAEDP